VLQQDTARTVNDICDGYKSIKTTLNGSGGARLMHSTFMTDLSLAHDSKYYIPRTLHHIEDKSKFSSRDARITCSLQAPQSRKATTMNNLGSFNRSN
jgi:hypothetical protein